MTRRFGSSVVVVAVALSLFTIIPGSASANPLAARAQAAAAQKLTDQVMKTVEPKISEIVAKAPLTPDFKAEIEAQLSASARAIAKREIDGAVGGRLPSPASLAKKVVDELGIVAKNLIESALDRMASGVGIVAADAGHTPTVVGAADSRGRDSQYMTDAKHAPASAAGSGSASVATSPQARHAQTPAPRGGKPRLAIRSFSAVGDDGETIAALFSIQTSLTAAYNIVSDAANAEYSLFGRVNRIDDRNVLTAVIIHAQSGRLLAGGYRMYHKIEEIIDAIPAIAQDLAAGAKRAGVKLPNLILAPTGSAEDVDGSGTINALAMILPVAVANAGGYTTAPAMTSRMALMRETLDSLTAENPEHTNEDKAKRLGAATGAEYVLIAETRSLGNLNMLIMQIYNAKNGDRIAGESLNITSLENAMEQLPETVAKLTSNAPRVVPPPPPPVVAPTPVADPTPGTLESPPVGLSDDQVAAAYENRYWYFTPRWNMSAAATGHGWWAFALELGRSYSNGMFVGGEVGGGRSNNYRDGNGKYTTGIGLNIGGIVAQSPTARLSVGGSLGSWVAVENKKAYYDVCNQYNSWGNCISRDSGWVHDSYVRQGILGPFIRLNIHNTVEFSYRLLIGNAFISQFMLGYQIRWGRGN